LIKSLDELSLKWLSNISMIISPASYWGYL